MEVSETSLAKGRDVRFALSGLNQSLTPGAQKVFDQIPDLEDWVLANIFGEVWGREGLDLKTRSLLTLAMQATIGAEQPLRGQLVAALNLGWTKEEVNEVFIHLMAYIGAPRALAALGWAIEVFTERGVE